MAGRDQTEGGYELVMLLGVAAAGLVVSGRVSVDAAPKLPERSPAWPGSARTVNG